MNENKKLIENRMEMKSAFTNKKSKSVIHVALRQRRLGLGLGGRDLVGRHALELAAVGLADPRELELEGLLSLVDGVEAEIIILHLVFGKRRGGEVKSQRRGKEEARRRRKQGKKKKKKKKETLHSHLRDLDERLLALELLQVEPLDLGLGRLAPLPDGGAEVALKFFGGGGKGGTREEKKESKKMSRTKSESVLFASSSSPRAFSRPPLRFSLSLSLKP